MGLQGLFLLSRFMLPALVLLYAAWLLLAHAQPAESAPTTDRVVSNCADDTALRQALLDIQNGGGGTLTFACGAAAIVVTGSTLPFIDANTIVDGGGLITLSGTNSQRIFTGGNGNLTLKNIRLTNGHAVSNDGGCIWNRKQLTLDNTIVENCVADHDGGGIYNYTGGNVFIAQSTIRNNTAQHDCGGICDYGNSVHISDSTLSGNMAVGNNAGGLGSVGVVVLTNTLVLSNSAYANGGGLYNNVLMLLTNVTVRENTARICGGGIFNGAGLLKISRSLVAGNAVTSSDVCVTGVVVGGGGGIATRSALEMSDSTLENNYSAEGAGGLLGESGADVRLTRVTVRGNKTVNYGGGVSFTGGVLTVTNSTFAENSAIIRGGGIHVESPAAAALHFVTFNHNALASSNVGGGGINTANAVVRMKNSVVANSVQGNCSGAVISEGYNISSDPQCEFTLPSDRKLTNPYLGTLANNGGLTLTYMPFPPSPAIDQGQCVAGINTDQRGVNRPAGLSCDIGAVEYQPGVPMPFLWLPVIRR
jgi:hypothetical protein